MICMALTVFEATKRTPPPQTLYYLSYCFYVQIYRKNNYVSYVTLKIRSPRPRRIFFFEIEIR